MQKLLRFASCSVTFVFVMVSCDNLVDPELPPSAVQFTPLPAYAVWWEMTEACSGRSSSLDAVQWYQVPDNVALEIDGKEVSAYWSAASNRIVVSSSVVRDGQVVRHEMLHALLRSKGHSRSEFLERCGGLVACTTQCIEDAGPSPAIAPFVPRVSPASMEVTTVVDPRPPRTSVNGGYFSVTVRVRNVAPNPVFVLLPTPANVGSPVSFSCRLAGIGGESSDVLALDNSAATFAAGETKVHVFDFFIGDGARIGQIFTGRYVLRGAYGGQAAPEEIFLAQ